MIGISFKPWHNGQYIQNTWYKKTCMLYSYYVLCSLFYLIRVVITGCGCIDFRYERVGSDGMNCAYDTVNSQQWWSGVGSLLCSYCYCLLKSLTGMAKPYGSSLASLMLQTRGRYKHCQLRALVAYQQEMHTAKVLRTQVQYVIVYKTSVFMTVRKEQHHPAMFKC